MTRQSRTALRKVDSHDLSGVQRRRPRLLFLSQTLPFPPDGGVHIRAFNLLRLLAARFDVTALCFFRRSARATREEVEQVAEALRSHAGLASVEAFPIPQEYSRIRLLWDHARSAATGKVYTFFTHESTEYRRSLECLLRETVFELIHVDSLDLSFYLRMLPSLPVICDHHNVESALLERRSRQESTSLRRMYVAHQARLMLREERRWCPKVSLNLTVSQEDESALQQRACGAAVLVVPNGVDTGDFEPAYGGDDGIVFVGGYTWFPNRDGMEYFAKQILPMIREKDPTAEIRWVGRAPEDVILSYRNDFGIEMTGYVRDIRPHVTPAACFIVPLRVGGGTRLKILDAWAMGKAIVSTSQGCEGLDCVDGENILIRDSPKAFSDAVIQVLSDPELRVRLGRAGRETAEAKYDWERIGVQMLAAYDALLPSSH